MKTKNVVIGVTGGIAAYKALDVVSYLKKAGFFVDVIMTNSACEFVSPLSFQSLSGNKVIIDMFEEPKSFEIQHIALAKKADIFVVVPATANIIGKVANGISDDMLSTTIMAAYGRCPIVFAPAMNTSMYKNPIVQNNIKKLREYGYNFINPESGKLACGDVGEGKLANVDLISKTIESMLYEKKDLVGKKVMVTAGPTIAPIDPVRYITNHSTGKMGYAIAEEARDRGAEVTLISGKTNITPPFGVKFVGVSTNAEMMKEVMNNFSESDIVIKAAAVSDYKAKNYSEIKIKKSDDSLNVEFIRDNDILKKLGQIKKNQILVGFAAESNDLIENAQKKLSKKNLDYIVANDILAKDTGFASSKNKVVILTKNGEKIELEKMSKRKVAENLFDLLSKKRS